MEKLCGKLFELDINVVVLWGTTNEEKDVVERDVGRGVERGVETVAKEVVRRLLERGDAEVVDVLPAGVKGSTGVGVNVTAD